jgi:class 3 adenylate cyclase
MSEVPARLGERLIAAGLLQAAALESALGLQRTQGGYLGDVLVDGGFMEEAALLRFLAAGADFVTAAQLAKARPADGLLESFPVATAERTCVLPLSYDAKARTLTVAVPELAQAFLDDVRDATGAARLRPLLGLRRALRAGIQRCYYKDPYAFVWLDSRPATTQRISRAAEEFMSRLTPPPVRTTPATRPPAALPHLLEVPSTAPALSIRPGAIARPVEPPEDAEAPSAAEPQNADLVLKLHEALEASQREVEVLRVANELSIHLARERNVFAVLQRVLAFAFDNIPADEGALLLRDGTSGELQTCAYRTRNGEPPPVSVSQTLIAELERTRQPVLATDAAYDPVFWQSKTVATHHARSLIGVPLLIADKVLGAITLVTYARAGAFSAKDLTVLTGIAAQTSIALENLTLSRKVSADAQIRDRLSRFLSPALVELAASGELHLEESGKLHEATILFADIRGFTALAERMEPQAVVQMLNHHFELMVDIVFSRGGLLDKFIGDGVMALWGLPLRREGDPARALQAALEMRERVRALNATAIPGREPFDIGIGINTGPVVFGAIGAARRMELTAVGDAVNVASRLCQAAASGEIIVSQSTLEAAGSGFRAEPLPPIQLKGKSQSVPAFRLTD